MEQYQLIDEKIQNGYRFMENEKSKRACDEWLSAWTDLKAIMQVDNIHLIGELEQKFPWTERLNNFVQDMEMELANVGIKSKAYYKHRLQFCQEMLELCDPTNQSMIENFHRGIADSYFEIGNKKEGERLYQVWLQEDPTWGWGYIGLADFYLFAKNRTSTDLEKANRILTEALSQDNLRDQSDVMEHLIDLYIESGDRMKAAELRKEWMQQ